MSTGHDCRFYEKTAGSWYYDLETYTREVYDTFGPFGTFKAAVDHLHRNHTNPGGYSVRALPGCKHDLLSPVSYPDNGITHNCDRCGGALNLRSADEQRRKDWENIVKQYPHKLILTALGKKIASEAVLAKLAKMGVDTAAFGPEAEKMVEGYAYWWKKVQATLDWDKTIKKVTRELRKVFGNPKLKAVVQDNPSRTYTIKVEGQKAWANGNRHSKHEDVRRVGRECCVDLNWWDEIISLHPPGL